MAQIVPVWIADHPGLDIASVGVLVIPRSLFCFDPPPIVHPVVAAGAGHRIDIEFTDDMEPYDYTAIVQCDADLGEAAPLTVSEVVSIGEQRDG